VTDGQDGWHRLDKRMLLVHPVLDAGRQAPLLIATVVVGSQSGHSYAELIGPAIVLAISLSRWVTTTYRIGADNIERRSGLVRRERLAVPRSRIRAVDVEASVVHRLLRLSVIKVRTAGTGGGGGQGMFELNGIATVRIDEIRSQLLERDVDTTDVAPAAPEGLLARLLPEWAVFAPLSSVGHVISLSVLGPLAPVVTADRAADVGDRVVAIGATAVVIALVLAYGLVSAVAACLHYVLTYGGLTVSEEQSTHRLHVRHGLLKQVHRTLDRGRLRGATLKEPLLVRAAGGAKLDAIMTGIKGGTMLLPAAPHLATRQLAQAVLDDAAPMTVELNDHGPAARRRRWTRALAPVAAAAVALAVVDAPAWLWLPLGLVAAVQAGLAHDRARGLGHAVLPGWLVTRSGSLHRHRDALHADGIIGWSVRQTWFQRRVGLATVVAATPAGKHGYAVLDLPADQAWDLVEAVTPGMTKEWARRAPTG
jgi:putative membrane protein